MRLLSSYVCAVLLCCALGAQEKPDFSGHWVLAEPAHAPPDVADELIVSQWTVDHVSPKTGQSFPIRNITIEHRFASGEKHSNHYQVGIMGGIMPGIPPGRTPMATRFGSRWNGDRLELERGSYAYQNPTGPFTEFKEEWSLDGDTLVILKTTRSSTAASATFKLTYTRRSGPPEGGPHA